MAEDTSLGNKVVIKEFLPQSIATRDQTHHTVSPYTEGDNVFSHLLTRFEEEARLLAGLRHPNIVKVTRLIEENDTAYFVMDYEEGETLEEYLEHTPKLTEHEILDIILPILEGTNYVHGEGVLHRDIAPDNIYLKANGMPILIDFGAARSAIAQESQKLSAIAKDGYSPPEQYTVNNDQNAATDIYALGAVMYRMITGNKPANSAHRQTAKLEKYPDPIGNLVENYRGKYSKSLLQAVTLALDISQGKRFQSVQEFKHAISKGTATNSNKSILWAIGAGMIIIIGMIIIFTKFYKNENKVEVEVEVDKPIIVVQAPSTSGLETNKSKQSDIETNKSKHTDEPIEPILILKATPVIQKVKKKQSKKEACQSGDFKECTNLGVQYVSGKKVKQDYFKAVTLFNTACENNHSKGCYNLAIMYQNGQGTRQDYLKAAKSYKKACLNKEPKGCSNLGYLYEKGVGVAQNSTKAAEFYTIACEGGITEGCSNLGYMYENGQGVAKDEKKAVELYTKVCDNDDMIGCNNLGFMYEYGQGTAVNKTKATQLFSKACAGGMNESCSSLGYMYENGEGISVDKTKASELYKKACEGGDNKGCYNLAVMHSSGAGIPKNNAKAIELFTKACNGGVNEGCYKLGYMYENGMGVSVNKAKASEFYKNSCNKGSASGCCSIGFIYENKKNIIKAKKFYGKACDLGENLGCEGFSRLN